jgi:tetratricopeptide (TPR) repeat protein
MKAIYSIGLMVLAFILPGKAQVTNVKYSDIKTQAAKLNKPILIEFFVTWAPTCKEFDSAIQSDNDTRKALGTVLLYQADVEKGDGKALAKEFKVKVFPSFIIVNAKGEPLDRWFGYDKADFIPILNDALKDKSTIAEMMERMEKAPSVDDAAALGRWHLAYGDCKKAAKYYEEAQKLNSDPTDDYSYEIFMSVACGSLKNEYSFEDVKQAADEVVRSKNEQKWQVYDACQRMVTLALDNDRKELVAGYIKGGLEATSDTINPDMTNAHDQLLATQMLFIDGDTAKAISYKKASMPEGWMNQAIQLNEFAQWCLGAKVNLSEAATMTEKAITLAHPGKEKASYYDTLADICHEEGDNVSAIDYTKKAVAEEPDDEDYTIQLNYYEGLANSK